MASIVFIEKDSYEIPADTKVIKRSAYAEFHKVESVFKKVHSKAEEILTNAKDAYVAAKKKGYEDGRKEANQKMAVQMTETAARAAQYFNNLENHTVSLVMGVVRKVLSDMDDDERIVEQVKSALGVIKNQKSIILRVSPATAAAVNQKLSHILSKYPTIDIVEVKEDKRLSPADLILETEIGIVDAGIAFQLNVIEETFKNCFKNT